MRRKRTQELKPNPFLKWHLEVQAYEAKLRCAPIEVGSVVYALLESTILYQIVRVLEVNGDTITVERVNAQPGDGWREGVWHINREDIYRESED